jgi:hypothetical protein
MMKKVRVPKWKPKLLWKPRQLADFAAELEKLQQNVRAAEGARSKSVPARSARRTSGSH